MPMYIRWHTMDMQVVIHDGTQSDMQVVIHDGTQ
jgi:hypothetical protein